MDATTTFNVMPNRTSRDRGDVPRKGLINVNTILSGIALATLLWIGSTAVETRDLVLEVRIHQHYTAQRLDRLESVLGLPKLNTQKP